MTTRNHVASLVTLAVACALGGSGADAQDKKDHGLEHLTVISAGVKREALIHFPKSAKKKDKHPVILAFHGHGHTMKDAAEAFGCHKHWEDAICVYPQGLNTPTPNDPKGSHPGWEVGGPRDYVFFDDLLVAIAKKHGVDDKHIFATGFSNGAYFSYGLWAHRGPRVRAIAPCAGTLERVGFDEQTLLKRLTPKPVLHIAGKKDMKAVFGKQEHAFKLVRQINDCVGKGEDWPKHKSPLHGELFHSKKHAPAVFIAHDGGHSVPDASGKLIVEFFKQVAK